MNTWVCSQRPQTKARHAGLPLWSNAGRAEMSLSLGLSGQLSSFSWRPPKQWEILWPKNQQSRRKILRNSIPGGPLASTCACKPVHTKEHLLWPFEFVAFIYSLGLLCYRLLLLKFLVWCACSTHVWEKYFRISFVFPNDFVDVALCSRGPSVGGNVP